MLFKTYTSAAFLNPFASTDERYWSYAELSVDRLWILVKVSNQGDKYISSSTLLLSSADQLHELNNRDDIKPEEVHILAPGFMSSEKVWKMHRVVKVSKGIQKYKNIESTIYRYDLANGSEIFDQQSIKKVLKSTFFMTLFP